jgi:hypothetical protein
METNGFNRPLQLVKRSVMPDVSSITFNPVQTDMVLNLLPTLGTPASSSAPRMGFNHPAPQIPVVGRAAITGNKLRSQSRTGNGVKHEVGFAMSTVKTLATDYSDARVALPWGTRDAWARNLGAIGIDQLLAQAAAEMVINTEEADFVAAIWVMANWYTQYASGVVPKWSSFASDPVKQINTAKRAIQKASGKKANHLVIPAEVADVLVIHPKIRSYFKGGQGGPVDQAIGYEDLARVFKLDKVTVAERIQNNGTDLTEANISLNFSITDGALLFVDNGPNPIGGSAFCRAGYNGMGAQGVLIDSGSDPKMREDWWNVIRQAGMNILDTAAGAFFEDLL